MSSKKKKNNLNLKEFFDLIILIEKKGCDEVFLKLFTEIIDQLCMINEFVLLSAMFQKIFLTQNLCVSGKINYLIEVA